MSRTLACLASAALTATALMLPGAAQAQAQGSAPMAQTTQTPTATVPMRRLATATERAAYGRVDPLARSVFWSQQNEIDPTDAEAGVKLAQALRELGQHDQAAASAQSVLVNQPANVEAMLELGRAHIARGQAFYGIAALEQARATAPGDWRPLSLLGVAYEQVQRTDDARGAWNEGLRLSPDNPQILANAAMAQMSDGDAAGAESLLRRAAAQPGASLQVRQNLALALGVQGKLAEAEQIIRRDLPPELAERNIAWLRQQAAAAASQADPTTPTSARTWDTLGG